MAVTAVDHATDTVGFIGPNNVRRIVTARNPEVREFIRRLRAGDPVDLVQEVAPCRPDGVIARARDPARKGRRMAAWLRRYRRE